MPRTRELTQQLSEAQATIEALLSGQIDAFPPLSLSNTYLQSRVAEPSCVLATCRVKT
jgi:hypothetical protein